MRHFFWEFSVVFVCPPLWFWVGWSKRPPVGASEGYPLWRPYRRRFVGCCEYLRSLFSDVFCLAIMHHSRCHQPQRWMTMMVVVPVKKSSAQALTSCREPNRSGNEGWYLSVLNWASENGLSLYRLEDKKSSHMIKLKGILINQWGRARWSNTKNTKKKRPKF